MYYTYNSLTGRLIGTTQLRANYPQGLEPLRPAEPISSHSSQNLQKKTTVEGSNQQSVRPSSSSSNRLGPGGIPYGPVPERLRLLQQKFQVNDGVPVHLKGGPKDKVLYFTTVALGVVGMGILLRNLYIMAFPRPPSSD